MKKYELCRFKAMGGPARRYARYVQDQLTELLNEPFELDLIEIKLYRGGISYLIVVSVSDISATMIRLNYDAQEHGLQEYHYGSGDDKSPKHSVINFKMRDSGI